jgi:FKBP-type peptidyl-prolyl cis-trans isomerase FklB
MRTMFWVLMVGICMVACQTKEAPTETKKEAAAAGEITKTSLKSADDKLNYSVGVEIGKNIKRNGLALSDAVFMKGIHDGLDEKEPLIDEEEMRKVKQDHAKAQREVRQKEREEETKKNKEAAEKFLKENTAKEGIVTTESGLQYKILKEGKGEKPKETDRVSVNYKGTTIDGTEFDSSYTRGKPATFSVNRVVKGWTEALQLMPVGSKWQVFIPPELGYGERGAGAKIPPNSVLIFEMELLDIVKDDADKRPGPPGGAAKPTKKAKPASK